jgi:hypothetical protein
VVHTQCTVGAASNRLALQRHQIARGHHILAPPVCLSQLYQVMPVKLM